MHNINLEVGQQNWGLSDIPAARKMHAGIELFGNPLVPPPFSITAGVNQGFLTYGLNIKLGFWSWAMRSIVKISLRQVQQEKIQGI